MAPNEKRFTAEEWIRIQRRYRESPERGVRTMFPDPLDECELGPFVPPETIPEVRQRRAVPRHHEHVETFIGTLSLEDVSKLQALLDLRAETVKWISEKNTKELQKLDGTVDFISSSRTAGKVLFYVTGAAVSFLTATFALAKAGYDIFALFRGVGR